MSVESSPNAQVSPSVLPLLAPSAESCAKDAASCSSTNVFHRLIGIPPDRKERIDFIVGFVRMETIDFDRQTSAVCRLTDNLSPISARTSHRSVLSGETS